MVRLDQIVQKVRSKNAGPFWLTIDIFCGNDAAFSQICDGLPTGLVARRLGLRMQDVKRFEIAELNVIKLSFPRPEIQGSVRDRDLHGASWAALLGGIALQLPIEEN